MDLHIKKLVTTFCFLSVCLTANASTIAEQLVVIQQQQLEQEAEKDSSPDVTIRPGHAKALKSLANSDYQNDTHKVVITKIRQLTDNQGNKYLGGIISKAELNKYLEQLKLILGNDYKQYRQNQIARDHNAFHVTLVSPPEFQNINKTKLAGIKSIRVSLQGLGRVSQGDKTSYFVVANSSDGDFYRDKLLLPKKDFHVTLAFDPSDIYGVKKDKSTLIKAK